MNICSWQAVLCSWCRWTYRRKKVNFHCLFEGKMLIVHYNGDNHIKNFHLGRYIVGYTFGNHVLRLRLRVAVKLHFRPYIRRYTSPNGNFEYSNPLSGLRILLHGVISLPDATSYDKSMLRHKGRETFDLFLDKICNNEESRHRQ